MSVSKALYLEVSQHTSVTFLNCCYDQVLHEIVKPPGPECPESLFLSLLIGQEITDDRILFEYESGGSANVLKKTPSLL